MTDQLITTDEICARWAYSELLSVEQGHKYRGAGIPELREKVRQGIPFEELDQGERKRLRTAWNEVRGALTPFLDSISAFQLVYWSKDDLADVCVIPYFMLDIMSDHLLNFVQQLPFKIWIEATPVRPLHQWHARYAVDSEPSRQQGPVILGRYPADPWPLVLLDGYHRAVAFWRRSDPSAKLPVYKPQSSP
jgi:hypothetical protein